MTAEIEQHIAPVGSAALPTTTQRSPQSRFPPRRQEADWPATRQDRADLLERLYQEPFTLPRAGSEQQRRRGLALLLNWLAEHPGDSWQDRWLVSGADNAGAEWRHLIARWLPDHGSHSLAQTKMVCAAINSLICADIVRPSVAWFARSVPRGGALARGMERARDREGFASLQCACDQDPHLSAGSSPHVLQRTAIILGAKGGGVADIVVGDVIELFDAESDARKGWVSNGAAFYQVLCQLGIFGPTAPARLQELRLAGQRTPEELIDRYNIACQPIRDLLVDYLRERQPAVDYNTLRKLAAGLGNVFWKDLERHHPGIDSLNLPREVADAWKHRLRTRQQTVSTSTGDRSTVSVERLCYRERLTPVRAFYLDLAQWALEDPSRWGPWVAPCPIRAEEINQRKIDQRRKARMDARTRERLPVLPALVRTAAERRKTAQVLLDAARRTPPGQSFTVDGHTLTRSVTRHPTAKIWVDDPRTGKRRDLGWEEEYAFWAWATVEILRATGIRVEELLELSHHSLVQYRLPTTSELVPLLQIVPSKTDAERLLVVSPELADVLSTIIRRVRDGNGAIAAIPAYDQYECIWLEPSPWLFQRIVGSERRRMNDAVIRRMLNDALAHTGLTDTSGDPLVFSPHDFRRIFITDAIMSGLPPHIAQVIAGCPFTGWTCVRLRPVWVAKGGRTGRRGWRRWRGCRGRVRWPGRTGYAGRHGGCWWYASIRRRLGVASGFSVLARRRCLSRGR